MSSKILSVQEARLSRASADIAIPGVEFRGLPSRALTGLVYALTAFGLMAVYSSSAPEALQNFHDSTIFLRKQTVAGLVGLILMFFMSKMDYRRLRKWAWPLAWISFGLLALTLVPGLGVAARGSTRWLPLGPVQFQPSEMCKAACIILMAGGLSRLKFAQLLPRIVMTGLIAAVVVKQPDLGSALMILLTLLSMLFISDTSLWLIGGLVLSGLVYGWHHIAKTPYQMARIHSWLNPYSCPQKEGWNIIQSMLAIGSGGVWGAGFGKSLQKLYYLPVQHADFIFAVIAEELGFVMCIALLGVFALFGYYGFRAALGSRTLFGRFLAIGITTSVTLQAVLNIMVTTGILPVTGVTLPFISYGGTSLVFSLGMAGILLSISRDRGSFEEDEDARAKAVP